MRSKTLYAVAAAALLSAGAAYAETHDAVDPTMSTTSKSSMESHADTMPMHGDEMNARGSVNPMPMGEAPAADANATDAAAMAPGSTVSVETVTNGPVPDTEENRQKYGEPMSNAGKRTAASGN